MKTEIQKAIENGAKITKNADGSFTVIPKKEGPFLLALKSVVIAGELKSKAFTVNSYYDFEQEDQIVPFVFCGSYTKNEGGTRTTYRQIIKLGKAEWDGNWYVSQAACSCPSREVPCCKHSAAFILRLIDEMEEV